MNQETYNKAMKVVEHSKKGYENEPFFGIEIDHKFESIISSIYQSCCGQDCIPNKEGKAIMLKNKIIDEHPFMEGNHRIASLLHRWFLKNNK
jgi:prophage maintenance system killer protein